MKSFFLTSLLLVFISANFGSAATFRVVPGGPNTHVEFVSEAPLENVVGETQMAKGQIVLAENTGTAEIHVDLVSLKTGLALRDEHMRNNHLQTAKFPETVFTATSIELPTGGLTPNQRVIVAVKGTLALHGVTHDITPVTYLTLGNDGHTLRVESKFTVKLADYAIDRPQFLAMKLAEEQRIAVDFTAVTDDSAAQLQAGDR